MSPASLKAELERRKELSDTRSELERRLMAFSSLRPRNGLWIYFGEGVPIDATNHRGVSGSACCHGYEQFNSIVTFNPVVMRSSLAKLAENSPCSNR